MVVSTQAKHNYTVIWEPQPGPQTALVTCPVFECFFGGSRGGGKTDGMLGEWAGHADTYGEHAIGLMIRRKRTQLVEAIERSHALYQPIGATFNGQEKMWRFPNGARLRFAYLEHDRDAEEYQGHSYTRVYVEEIGTFPSQLPIKKLMATLRSGSGVPCCFRSTGNPGGPGHQWVKNRYIDDFPQGWEIIKEKYVNPIDGKILERERVFIPSKIQDNKYLGADYVANLQMSGSPELVRAWLEGDWSAIAGAFFPEFGMSHIVTPCELPKEWTRFRSYDDGSASPFCCLWWAVSDGSLPQFPRGALVCYREWYGSSEPNVGLKLQKEAIAKGILDREAIGEKMAYSRADPAIFKEDGGPSVAEVFRKNRVIFTPADNTRIAGHSQFRSRLIGDEGKPMMFFFSTCVACIRTIPALPHDTVKPEDVDTDAEDHAYDAARYGVMSRPWVKKIPEPPKPLMARIPTFDEAMASQKKYKSRY